jgi:anthranilate phosphoribosyltransferase
VRRQAVGVADPAMAERVIAVLEANGAQHAWVFYGDDGLDEITTTTTSTVFELRDGDIRRFTLDPAASGFARADAGDLVGGDAAGNADVVRLVLDGKPGAVRDIALVNAAAALVIAGVADDFDAGAQKARDALDGGGAARVLDDWLRVGTAAHAAEGD